MNKFKIKKQNNSQGFTLIELIVTLGIFVILISIVIGGFINALRGQRVAVGLMEINDNMGLVLEQMAREIRMGYDFILVSGELRFTNSSNKSVSYRLNNNLNDPNRYAIERDEEGAGFEPITAENIKIDKFNVFACGQNIDLTDLGVGGCDGSGGVFQPRITLSMRITGKGKDVYIEKLGAYNEIQTTISSRQY